MVELAGELFEPIGSSIELGFARCIVRGAAAATYGVTVAHGLGKNRFCHRSARAKPD